MPVFYNEILSLIIYLRLPKIYLTLHSKSTNHSINRTSKGDYFKNI